MRTGTSAQASRTGGISVPTADGTGSPGAGGLRLGGARADFVAGLGRKVTDLRHGLARVREDAADLAGREELRRRLHALSSGAKLMKFDAMDRAIAEALGTIDRTAIDVPMESVDLDAIEQVLEDLPALAWGDGDSGVSRVQPAAKPSVPEYAALVIGPAMIAEALLGGDDDQSAPRAKFTCESTPDAQAAFDLAKTTEPDLIVLDADLEAATELVDALMDEPVTEGLPIVVIGSFLEQGEASRYVAMGVAKTLAKPTSREALRSACLEALDAGADLDVVPNEVRISAGGTGSISVAPPNEPEQARSDRSRSRARGPAAEVRLQGRRVVVADDDPAVVWFLADLLKSAGCTVYEAFDGKKALELAYTTSPDLVLSDILMPELDGFTLCRTLGRDVALRDVPVILLSWKADLLQRVHELGAGAAGYVRKESDTRAIVARVREALRPRARIEMRLRDDDGEVRGRIDGISVRTLLEIVCATRPDARVTVRDASFVYEVEVRCGAPLRATRTAGDGGVLRGSRVLAAMLGIGAGRFSVTTSATIIDAELDGNLAAQLAKPIARARAATSLLMGSLAMKARRVHLDEEALEDYLRATPQQAREIALRIADGTPPRALVVEGVCEASLIEDLVSDLASRGVVCGVDDDDGNDLLGPETARIALHTDSRAQFAPRTATPSPMAAEEMVAEPKPEVSCVKDEGAPLCESPIPSASSASPPSASSEPPSSEASSLADAVIREIATKSPRPAQLSLLDRPAPVFTRSELSSEPPPAYEGTPPHDQILALAEATVVDDTTYGTGDDDNAIVPGEISVPIPCAEVSAPLAPSESRAMKTPFTAVKTSEDVVAGLPKKKGPLPMIAFVAASGVVAWAVMHFSLTPPAATKSTEKAPPAAETSGSNAKQVDATYTDVAADAQLPTGQGVLDISAPGDSVVLVDGSERGRGSVTLPLWSGSHEVRISGAAGEHKKPVDVRAGRVAHLKF